MYVEAGLEAVKGWSVDYRGHEIVPGRCNSSVRAGQLDSWTKRRFLGPLIALAGPWQAMDDISLVEASQLTSSSPFAIL
ncbi:hypothetical protein BpHYR1_016700 [Brachionus plicatilis]|uniref:Uncharacterized protein n=1 Tax=Brachionus plicatilis TaxID=10195 RepID=A0A3M7RHS5_BRAPC|nr:hypothetical protein BpHYR1_016700 [Brachionus plicatilis]